MRKLRSSYCIFILSDPSADTLKYQELFAICQALPGPRSTEILFCIILIHGRFMPASSVFLIWNVLCYSSMTRTIRCHTNRFDFPAIGISRVKNQPLATAYALLSGLNAPAEGIIAPTAVQLAEKAIKDKVS